MTKIVSGDTSAMVENMVSIITPSYNSEEYIEETIRSVLNQTYVNWEMLIVDDCSSDETKTIVKEIAAKDSRVKLIELQENSGAAMARNTALSNATGRYIAYLDADDLWYPNKLERQIDFMTKNDVAFTCCDYDKITRGGTHLNKIVNMPRSMTYEQLLSNTIIQTVGVLVDLKYVNKDLLVMPNVRRGQDAATWMQLLKNDVKFYGQNEVLASYRRVPQSLSSNKIKAAQRTWHIYRKIEKLGLLKSMLCICGWAINASKKRIYIKKRF